MTGEPGDRRATSGASLEMGASGDDDGLRAVYAALEAQIARERGAKAWLRSRSSRWRIALAVAVALLAVALLPMASPRGDLEALSWSRCLMPMGALFVLMLASVGIALRPLHSRPLPRWVEDSALALALGGAAAIAFMPLAEPSPNEPTDWPHALGCVIAGVVIALPGLGALLLVDQGGRRVSALFAAAAAGLAASGALALHCPIDAPEHVIFGHAPIGVVFAAAILGIRWLSARWRGRGAARARRPGPG